MAGLDPFAGFLQQPVLYLYRFLGTIVAFGTFGAILGSREAELEESTIRDSLTGLFNSRYLHARLRQELDAARIYSLADRALYRAKRQGRDQVVVSAKDVALPSESEREHG